MIFFESWRELFRIALSAFLVYPFIILCVRVAGKRSTAQMNNFDWIVTVALGSIVGSAILLKDVVLLEVFLALSLLLGFQYAITKAAVRWDTVSKVVRAPATLLFYDGGFIEAAMKHERIASRELESAVREAGYGNLSEVQAVILEADASFSVLGRKNAPSSLLDDVERIPEPDAR